MEGATGMCCSIERLLSRNFRRFDFIRNCQAEPLAVYVGIADDGGE
ncbi:MAG: hypothetical protein ACYDBT_00430 [Desulfobulbaceae bacterium]